ncbi:MAG: Dabb family protein [Lachnospiraceae bacterium]|nr:Dabb family protein [Lachnospiraceae bacterium]
MVKHIILWTLKEEYKEAEKEQIKKEIKEGLEGLKGKIPGLLDITVNTEPLSSSNCDLMLDSSFVDEEALKGYSVDPAHVEVANTKVRPFTAKRVCMDYISNS